MNYDDDTNPFADSSIRQATAASFSNQPAYNDYNPFTNTTEPARPVPPYQQPSVAAVLPPAPAPVYQPPPPVYQPSTPVYQPPPPSVYQPSTPASASVTKPFATQQSTERYTTDSKPAATRLDLSQYERQQAELEEREKRLAERERAISNPGKIGQRVNNFPPLPSICPCRPCFYQDINIEIPTQFQLWVRYIYYLWLAYAVTLFLNMIAALSYFVVAKEGAATFGLSLVYLLLFVPLSYVCWFRPVYRAFRTDSSVSFMVFFFNGVLFIVKSILFAIGIIAGMCGFARFSIMSINKVVGTMMIILGILWTLISVAAIVGVIRVHRLYRQTGASLEQAQREFQTAFVNNSTVRGAAREVATAGINQAMSSDGNQQRPIY